MVTIFKKLLFLGVFTFIVENAAMAQTFPGGESWPMGGPLPDDREHGLMIPPLNHPEKYTFSTHISEYCLPPAARWFTGLFDGIPKNKSTACNQLNSLLNSWMTPQSLVDNANYFGEQKLIDMCEELAKKKKKFRVISIEPIFCYEITTYSVIGIKKLPTNPSDFKEWCEALPEFTVTFSVIPEPGLEHNPEHYPEDATANGIKVEFNDAKDAEKLCEFKPEVKVACFFNGFITTPF